jgi:hypothetical protein
MSDEMIPVCGRCGIPMMGDTGPSSMTSISRTITTDDGVKFHPDCYWRERADRLEAEVAALRAAGDRFFEIKVGKTIGGDVYRQCSHCWEVAWNDEPEKHAGSCPVPAWRALEGLGDRREDTQP